MTDDPLWPRASSWLTTGGAASGRRLAVVGVPLSRTSISPSGAHETPDAVRAALRRFSSSHSSGVDLVQAVHVTDHGDLPVSDASVADADQRVHEALQGLGIDAELVVLLGGDNAITRPCMRALLSLSTSGLLTLDAHHDVRGFHAGATNGTPVRGLIEDGLTHVTQIGIGTLSNSAAYRGWCEDHGITVIGVDQCRGRVDELVRDQLDLLPGALYVDLDVDVVDSAFVPGCPGARPGGLAPHELLAAAFEAGRHPRVRAIDITEVDATRDPDGRTVDLAAMCLLSAAAGLASRHEA
jgi:formiminoglutamase